MTIEIKIYEDHGIRHVEEQVPVGYCVIDDYTPTSSTTPWDYYGMKHQRELSCVLRNNSIPCILLHTTYTKLHPMGSGPKGSVRFGDDMLPGRYRIAVPIELTIAAQLALSIHKQAIENWLYNKGPMPQECRND